MTDQDRQQRIDIYERVTHAIVAAIERGGTRYRMPWHHDGAPTSRPVNAVSGKGYRGANTLLLWAAAELNAQTRLNGVRPRIDKKRPALIEPRG